MIKVISIDPGVTSGYCYAHVEPQQNMIFYPFQIVDDVDELWQRLIDFQPRYIVMEDFEFRQGRQKSSINLFPKELIGVARLYTMRSPAFCSMQLQKAMTGKSYYTDTLLKKQGLYKTSLGHGMDATRHLLHWITFGPGYALNGKKGSINEFAKRIDSWPPK